ncbi:hypothetical protein pipiens_002644 [Culex pipiens pipiens]|uniref:Acyl-CoA dehydrogenase/oxidase C-terminal domain-containing protein n=1 Tax=Culex pipiens pipiens TaxID=38569 RepID=A0ABD1DBE9_CULPP
MEQLDRARIGIASQALGIAQAALEEAIAYAKQRIAFGEPLLKLPAVRTRIAEMAVRIESSRLLVRKAATEIDRQRHATKACSMAKWVAGETATFAAHNCQQIMGGMGYVKDLPAERLYRDARITEIYGGVTDVQKGIVADQVIKDPACAITCSQGQELSRQLGYVKVLSALQEEIGLLTPEHEPRSSRRGTIADAIDAVPSYVFWMQRLGVQPGTTYCKYLLRKQEYEKVTWTDLLATIPAIRNLKTKLYDTIDRNDPVQLNEFRKLLSLLFKSNASAAGGKTAAARSLCQPMKNISDFVLL